MKKEIIHGSSKGIPNPTIGFFPILFNMEDKQYAIVNDPDAFGPSAQVKEQFFTGTAPAHVVAAIERGFIKLPNGNLVTGVGAGNCLEAIDIMLKEKGFTKFEYYANSSAASQIKNLSNG